MRSFEWLHPLGKRVATELPSEDRSIVKAIKVLSPVLIYYLINTIIVDIFRSIAGELIRRGGSASTFIGEHSETIAACISMMGMVIAALCLIPVAKSEYPVVLPNKGEGSRMLKTILLGVSLAITVNLLMAVTGLSSGSEAYDEVASHQLSLNPVLGILMYGLISPFAEELVFRVIVYNRLRRMYGLVMALVIAPLIFGIYHMNYVQAIYGTVMGLFLCWIYERYGSALYPYLVHAAANISVYVVMSIDAINKKIGTAVGLGITIAVCLIMIILIAIEKPAGSRETGVARHL
ncbi:MAG: CPBP family intramembrane metalloprotease [Lachnospiraceae bacterium]|nr:CPBP family intramembrane metalloprotease [Lachnospiraceae bacterium]